MAADDNQRGFRVAALGEIAIRCADIEVMTQFYNDIVGLDILSDGRGDGIVFFRIAEGFQGHTTVLALFRGDAGRPDLHPQTTQAPITGARSSLHHLALTVAFEQQEAAMRWLTAHEIPYRVQTFNWIGWRGIFFHDPEGNTVEFVAHAEHLRSTER